MNHARPLLGDVLVKHRNCDLKLWGIEVTVMLLNFFLSKSSDEMTDNINTPSEYLKSSSHEIEFECEGWKK